MYGATSKLCTSAAILTGCAVASKERIGPTPLLPFKQADQKASRPIPLGATTPMPVITTLRICPHHSMNRLRRDATPSRDANSAIPAGLAQDAPLALSCHPSSICLISTYFLSYPISQIYPHRLSLSMASLGKVDNAASNSLTWAFYAE